MVGLLLWAVTLLLLLVLLVEVHQMDLLLSGGMSHHGQPIGKSVGLLRGAC